jgi:hypothetical protein
MKVNDIQNFGGDKKLSMDNTNTTTNSYIGVGPRKLIRPKSSIDVSMKK